MPIRIHNDGLSQSELKSLLSYDPDTGHFHWREREWPAHCVSWRLAGGVDASGYWNIKFNRRTYKAHRLAWLYVYGAWPEMELDHINRVRSDNRISNLREVTRAENMKKLSVFRNNKSGLRGVFYDKSRHRWRARVTRDGKQRYLGSYKTAELAEARYLAETS